MYRVRFVNYPLQYSLLEDEIDAAIKRVFRGGDFILRADVRQFEESTADFVGTKYAIGLNSGTYQGIAGEAGTETATFTGNGNDTYPVTLKKVAYFTAVTAGTMGFEDAITDATLNASGDQVTTTQTVTL